MIISKYGTRYLYPFIWESSLPFLILHVLKNKPIKIIYYFYHLSKFNQTIKDKTSVDRYIYIISKKISLGYFIYSRQPFLDKMLCYFVIKSILKVLLATISKRSFLYLLKNFSINNLINIIVANEIKTKLPLNINVVNQSLSDISFQGNTVSTLEVLPQKNDKYDGDSLRFFTRFLARTSVIYFIEHFILRKYIKFYVVQKFFLIFAVVFGKDIILLIYEALICLITEIGISDYIIKSLSNFININKTIENFVKSSKNVIFLASISLDEVLKEYAFVDHVVQYLSEPSDIDWISIISQSNNVVKKTMQLGSISLDEVLKEYAFVDHVVQYLSEPSDIDWISIISQSNNIVKKTMQLGSISLDEVLKEYAFVDHVVQYLSGPSDIDWISIISQSNNVVKKTMQLGSISLDEVLKEYAFVDHVVQYLSEPSDIDWISIISQSNNVVKKTVQLGSVVFSVTLEESLSCFFDDLTIVGDFVNNPFLKKLSVMSLDSVIQTNAPFVLKKISSVFCGYFYDNIHDDIF